MGGKDLGGQPEATADSHSLRGQQWIQTGLFQVSPQAAAAATAWQGEAKTTTATQGPCCQFQQPSCHRALPAHTHWALGDTALPGDVSIRSILLLLSLRISNPVPHHWQLTGNHAGPGARE